MFFFAFSDPNIQKSQEVLGPSGVDCGWALKVAKKAQRMTPKLREYLTEIFKEGAKTGLKADPQQCVDMIRENFAVDE